MQRTQCKNVNKTVYFLCTIAVCWMHGYQVQPSDLSVTWFIGLQTISQWNELPSWISHDCAVCTEYLHMKYKSVVAFMMYTKIHVFHANFWTIRKMFCVPFFFYADSLTTGSALPFLQKPDFFIPVQKILCK